MTDKRICLFCQW